MHTSCLVIDSSCSKLDVLALSISFVSAFFFNNSFANCLWGLRILVPLFTSPPLSSPSPPLSSPTTRVVLWECEGVMSVCEELAKLESGRVATSSWSSGASFFCLSFILYSFTTRRVSLLYVAPPSSSPISPKSPTRHTLHTLPLFRLFHPLSPLPLSLSPSPSLPPSLSPFSPLFSSLLPLVSRTSS